MKDGRRFFSAGGSNGVGSDGRHPPDLLPITTSEVESQNQHHQRWPQTHFRAHHHVSLLAIAAIRFELN